MKFIKMTLVFAFCGVLALSFAQSLEIVPAVSYLKALAAPAISFEKKSHDFGTIPQNEPVNVKFSFTNTGDAPLFIKEVKTSCGCTATDYPTSAIAPGENASVTAEYNAKKVGAFSKTITVVTNVEGEDIALKIKGIVE